MLNEISAFLLSDHPAAQHERLRRRVARHAAVHGRSFPDDWRALADPASADPTTVARLRWLLDDDLQLLRLRLRFEELVRERVDPAYRLPAGDAAMTPPAGGQRPLEAPYPGPAARAVLRELETAVVAGTLTAEQADQQRWEHIIGFGDLPPEVAAELLYVPSDTADAVELARQAAVKYASIGIELHQQLHALTPADGEAFDQLTDRMNWYTATGKRLADAAEQHRQQARHNLLGRVTDAQLLSALLRAHQTIPGLADPGEVDPAWRYRVHATAEYLPASMLYRHLHEAIEVLHACPPDRSHQLAAAKRAEHELRAAQPTAARPPRRWGRRPKRAPDHHADRPARQRPRRPEPGSQAGPDQRLVTLAEQVAALEQHQQQRARWLSQHRTTLLLGQAAALELDSRMTRLWHDLLRTPPPYLTARLGLPPRHAQGRQAWLHAAQAIERYRAECGVQDLEHPFGPRPANLSQQVLRAQALQAVRHARAALRRTRPDDRRSPEAAVGIDL